MARPYDVTIVNGTGSKQIVNGDYAVTAVAAGYDITSIEPNSITVATGVDTHTFTIAANGTLTLHVTVGGSPVVGATFRRCDALGTEYGATITTDAGGNAIFEHVPFADTGAPTIYYKQKTSSDDVDYDDSLQNTTMIAASETREVINTVPEFKTLTLTDEYYADLPIASATVTLA